MSALGLGRWAAFRLHTNVSDWRVRSHGRTISEVRGNVPGMLSASPSECRRAMGRWAIVISLRIPDSGRLPTASLTRNPLKGELPANPLGYAMRDGQFYRMEFSIF